MARVTYHVALPFVQSGRGRVVPGDAVPANDAAHAKRLAEALASRKDRFVGAVAFSRSGDPDFGDWDDAVAGFVHKRLKRRPLVVPVVVEV